jgi:hypothetical protein
LKGTQGKLQEKDCEDQILNALLNAPPEGLITARILERVNFSDKTIYKYLRDLHKVKKWIDYVDSKPEFGKIESPLHLTADGLKEVKRRKIVKTFEKLNAEYATSFIISYKIHASYFWIQPPMFAVVEGEINWDNREKLPLFLAFADQNRRVDAEKVIQQFDDELGRLGYNDEEIYSLWLLERSFYISHILLAFGSDDFFNKLPFKVIRRIYTQVEKEQLIRKARAGIDAYTQI